jgi:hypothetical protein
MSRDQQEAVAVANQVREALRAPFDLRGHAATLTASIGIAMYPDDALDPETLIKYADTAMGGAKQAGRDGYRFFTAGMNVQVLARWTWNWRCAMRSNMSSSSCTTSPRWTCARAASAASKRCCAGAAPATAWWRRPNSCRCWKTRADRARGRLGHRRRLPPDRRVARQRVGRCTWPSTCRAASLPRATWKARVALGAQYQWRRNCWSWN